MLNVSKIKKFISQSNHKRLKIKDLLIQPHISRKPKPLIQELSVSEMIKRGNDYPKSLLGIKVKRGY